MGFSITRLIKQGGKAGQVGHKRAVKIRKMKDRMYTKKIKTQVKEQKKINKINEKNEQGQREKLRSSVWGDFEQSQRVKKSNATVKGKIEKVARRAAEREYNQKEKKKGFFEI